MASAARMTDPFNDGDIIASGSGNVFINNLPAARMTDMTAGHPPWPPTVVDSGSGIVFINNLPAARLADTHAVHCGPDGCHPGTIIMGSGNVFIG